MPSGRALATSWSSAYSDVRISLMALVLARTVISKWVRHTGVGLPTLAGNG